jgi:hypothetical protein
LSSRSKLVDHGLEVPLESGHFRVAVPLEPSVSYNEKLLSPRRAPVGRKAVEITL